MSRRRFSPILALPVALRLAWPIAASGKPWARYLPAPTPASASLVSAERSAEWKLRSLKNYARSEDQTYLTLPEWYIVYSAEEYAAFLDGHQPSAFPFFRSVGQFWNAYRAVLAETWNAYRFNWGYHAMLGVIGTSYSTGYAISGLYEGSVGRLTEWLSRPESGAPETAEDRFIREVAKEYAAFIHGTPWYEFPFAQKLRELWAVADAPGASVVRRWERRLSFTAELACKSAWGWLMKKATQSAYAPEESEILAWTRKPDDGPLRVDPPARVLDPPDAHSELLSLPRYEPFTATVTRLARQGVRFVEIAGNRRILMTVIAPRDWTDTRGRGERLVEWETLTRPGQKRVAISVAIDRLHEVIPSLEAERVKIDHIYDY